MTVRELLADRRFHLEPLVTADLDRAIRWVHTSEMPDPGQYLRGGEVVLSAGIWYWSGTSPTGWVEGLVVAGAAAVGFGVTALHPSVPAELVEACRSSGLTLFRVPVDVAFISVAEAFIDRYVDEHEQPLRESMRRSRQLVASAAEGKGLAGVLRIIARHRPGAAFVVERRRGALAWAHAAPSDERVARILAGIADLDAASASVDGAVVRQIVGAATTSAYLVLEQGDAHAERRADPGDGAAVVEQALPFLALELQREVALRESERRFVAELFDLVMAGPSLLPASAARLEALGMPPGSPLLAVAAEAPDVQAALEGLEAAVADARLLGLVGVKGLELWGLIWWDRPADDLQPAIEAFYRALGPDGYLGIGGLTTDVAGLRESLIEARQAAYFAKRRRGERFARYSEIGSHTLLLALQDDGVVRAFRDAVLQSLVDYDDRRGTELVRTLELFLESGGEYRSTAKALHVHVNTLRLRLARIEALTGRSFASVEDRVDFFIALRSRA
jgi:hypothetical protein